MDSAEGQVQQMHYDATFPLLLNISDQPTYFMALKDAAGLVKMYAMVNVSQYQIVATGATVADCESNYRRMLVNNSLISEEEGEVTPSDRTTVSGVLAEIRSVVVEGNTVFYLRLEGGGNAEFYYVSAADDPTAVLLNVGESVTIHCDALTDFPIHAYSIQRD